MIGVLHSEDHEWWPTMEGVYGMERLWKSTDYRGLKMLKVRAPLDHLHLWCAFGAPRSSSLVWKIASRLLEFWNGMLTNSLAPIREDEYICADPVVKMKFSWKVVGSQNNLWNFYIQEFQNDFMVIDRRIHCLLDSIYCIFSIGVELLPGSQVRMVYWMDREKIMKNILKTRKLYSKLIKTFSAHNIFTLIKKIII